MQSNSLKGFPSYPCQRGYFFCVKTNFIATAVMKQQRQLTILTNSTMVCSYHYSCLVLPVDLVDFQVE